MRGVTKIVAIAAAVISLCYLLSPILLRLFLWNLEDFLVGDVTTPVVYQKRIHAYITDDNSSCEIPDWIPSGTLVTTRRDCLLPKAWTTQNVAEMAAAFTDSIDRCSRGERMLCLILSNSDLRPFVSGKGRHKYDPLNQLTRQTLSLYTNEDYSWRCNSEHLTGCQVIPGGASQCILNSLEGLPFDTESSQRSSWKKAMASCKINRGSIRWNRG